MRQIPGGLGDGSPSGSEQATRLVLECSMFTRQRVFLVSLATWAAKSRVIVLVETQNDHRSVDLQSKTAMAAPGGQVDERNGREGHRAD